MKAAHRNGFARTSADALFIPTDGLAGTEFAQLESGSFQRLRSGSSLFLSEKHLSRWSRSGAKRIFDCTSVLFMLPLLVPILLVIAIAVRLTSAGPVLFLQKRTGRHGKIYTILKFRTMVHAADKTHHAVTTSDNQIFTPVGPFLRRCKLDELPQLTNVLAGHMSLVGPRPKLREHAIADLHCRPGITGAATIAFALEEAVLARLPERQLGSFYHSVVLPAKHKLDAEYMACATFVSDLKLIADSVLRRWDISIMDGLLTNWASEQEESGLFSCSVEAGSAFAKTLILPNMDRPASTRSGLLRMPDPAGHELQIER